MGVSFDCFGTLVAVDRPADPAGAVAAALRARGVEVPADWIEAYASVHVDAPDGAEVALPTHVEAALASRGVSAPGALVREAVLAAFEPSDEDRADRAGSDVDVETSGDEFAPAPAVETRPGAQDAVRAAGEYGPVAICSNCSVPGLVERCLERSALDLGAVDAIVTSVDCGWRKPDPRIFEATAAALGAAPDELLHVGDDPATDGGVEAVGGAAILLEDVSLSRIPRRLEVYR